MEWLNGMNAAVNYLEEHILEEPDLEKLGRLAGCSAHHFQRIFTYIGGITLSEYLRRRRMSLAAVDLKNENTFRGFKREGLIREGKMVSIYCDYYLYGMTISRTIHHFAVFTFYLLEVRLKNGYNNLVLI